MLTPLLRVMSLKNLQAKTGGQIATILILIMVAILIFILITVNIGQVSSVATNLANAADSSALNLGSQLSTKSHMLWVALGNTNEKCKSSGWFGIVLGLTISIVFPWTGPLVAIMIGEAYHGQMYGGGTDGAVSGAVQGFTFVLEVVAGVVVGALAGSAAGPIGTVSGAVWGGIVGGTLAVGGAVYNKYVQDEMSADAIKSAVKSLNGLPEYDRYREGAFYQAFSQTIDDPNKTQDIYDSGGDGDTQKMVPYFQYWWDRRIAALKGITVDPIKTIITNFINGPLVGFKQYVTGITAQGGFFSRQEVEGVDGALVELARAMNTPGHNLAFWQPGPSKVALDNWHNTSCGDPHSCPPPFGYDQVDSAVDTLSNLLEAANRIQGKTITQLSSSWDSWVTLLYDPSDTGDFYDTLGTVAQNANSWSIDIENKRLTLPDCVYKADHTIDNPPSKEGGFGTINSDTFDEFANVRQKIGGANELIQRINDFRAACKNLYEEIQNIQAAPLLFGGTNPATYTWTDSRGMHSITVQANFNIPKTSITHDYTWGIESGTCIKLKNGYDTIGATWVSVTRKDPVDKSTGTLGRLWNKLTTNSDQITVSRISRIYYSPTSVGIHSTH